MKLNLGSMILASAILAVPVLAATPDNNSAANSPANANTAVTTPAPHSAAGTTATSDDKSAANSPANANPAATAPAPHNPPGMAATGPATPHNSTAATPGNHTTAAAQPSPPKFMTSDDQVRVGKVIGATVYNDKDQSIGSIDDVLMSHDNKANTAVISVGGFLGMGSKLVSVPFDKLKIEKDKIMMPGATQDALKGMPEYKYNA